MEIQETLNPSQLDPAIYDFYCYANNENDLLPNLQTIIDTPPPLLVCFEASTSMLLDEIPAEPKPSIYEIIAEPKPSIHEHSVEPEPSIYEILAESKSSILENSVEPKPSIYEIAAESEPPVGEVLHYCLYCEINLGEEEMLDFHMEHHSAEDPWRCSVCGLKTTSKQQFIRHVEFQ